MSTANFNLRNIGPDVMDLLKKEAVKQNLSVNSFILQMIEKGLGISHSRKKSVYHDLDDLAGTWDKKEKNVFDKNVKSFEKIDKELWT